MDSAEKELVQLLTLHKTYPAVKLLKTEQVKFWDHQLESNILAKKQRTRNMTHGEYTF